jgi:hypothetical protein
MESYCELHEGFTKSKVHKFGNHYASIYVCTKCIKKYKLMNKIKRKI